MLGVDMIIETIPITPLEEGYGIEYVPKSCPRLQDCLKRYYMILHV